MKRAKVLFGILLLVGAGLMVLSVMPNVHAAAWPGGSGGGSGDSWKSVTATYEWKDVFGATVVTTHLTQNWKYNGGSITWHSNPQFTWSKAWWLVWAYESGIKTGTWVENPGWYNIAWGTGHWNVGVPTPWGTLGLSQDLYTKIGYYGNGDYWTSAGFGYIS